MRKTILWASGLTVLLAGSAQAQYDGRCSTLDDVMELPEGHFCEVDDSHLESVERTPSDYPDFDGSGSTSYDSYQRNAGVQAVIENWSGGAFDSARDRLLIFGGGHNGYGGNEIYAFSLRTLSWERITDPTLDPPRCTADNPDGTPTSRHSYGGLEYLAHVDRFFALGGAWDCGSGGAGASGTWTFDLANPGTSAPWGWERRNRADEPATRVEDNAIYDPVSGRVYYDFGSSPSGWASYDFETDSWTEHNRIGGGYQRVLVIPGTRRIIVEFAGGDPMQFWDLESSELTSEDIATTGATAMESVSNPGVAYDTRADRIVSWRGGTSVYSFDVDARQWSEHLAPATNMADPGEIGSAGGVYGRFRYSENLNVYVMVDSVEESVFLYRFSPGSGMVPPDPPPGPVDAGGATPPPPAMGDAAAGVDGGRPSMPPMGTPGEGPVTGGCSAVPGASDSWGLLVLLGLLGVVGSRRRA